MGQDQVQGRMDWRTDVGWVKIGGAAEGVGRVTITDLEIGGVAEDPLRLEGSSRVMVSPVVGEGPFGVTLDRLRLTNGVQSLLVEGEVEWPDRGRMNLEVEGVDSGWARAFVSAEMPDVRLDRLKASAVWDEGPMRVDLELR